MAVLQEQVQTLNDTEMRVVPGGGAEAGPSEGMVILRACVAGLGASGLTTLFYSGHLDLTSGLICAAAILVPFLLS